VSVDRLYQESGVPAGGHWVRKPDEHDLAQLIRESLGQLKIITAGA
jgi:hypothetical protein